MKKMIFLIMFLFLFSCKKEEAIEVRNKEYFEYVYNDDETYSIKKNDNTFELEVIIIPELHNEKIVSGICANGFANLENLKNITIPATITHIYDNAFSNCLNLEEVVIKERSKLQVISKHAFNKCKNLKNIEIPENLIKIEQQAFNECLNLENIDLTNVRNIERYAFFGCKKLKEVFLTKNTITVEKYCFEGCSNLKIYLEYNSIPKTFEEDWNSSNCEVILGYNG